MDYQKFKYDNMIVGDVSLYNDEMRLTYLIEQEHRSWGVKGISLYDIQGYSEIEVELHLYPEGSDDEIIKEVKRPAITKSATFVVKTVVQTSVKPTELNQSQST